MKIKKYIKSKQGAAAIVTIMLLSIVFIIVLNGVLDICGAYSVKKRMSVSTNAAAMAASAKYDESQVPYGIFRIDEPLAENSFVDILSSNLDVSLVKNGNYYEYVNPVTGNKTTCYIYIYNSEHKGTYVNIPNTSDVPAEVTDQIVQVSVDRPTIYSILTQEYHISPLYGGMRIKFKKITSAQLNAIPQAKQKSATYN